MAILFSMVAAPFYIPTGNARGLVFLYPCSHLFSIFYFFIIASLIGVKYNLIMVLIHISLMTSFLFLLRLGLAMLPWLALNSWVWVVLLLQPLECWDYRYIPPHQVYQSSSQQRLVIFFMYLLTICISSVQALCSSFTAFLLLSCRCSLYTLGIDPLLSSVTREPVSEEKRKEL